MTKKIIHILCHTLNNDDTLNYHTFGNFASRSARNIIKRTNRYSCEVWIAVNSLNKNATYRREGVVYRLFPATTLNKLLESFFGIISSPEMLKSLGKLDPSNTLISFQGERSLLIHSIIRSYPYFYYTLQYHGYGQPRWLDWLENLLLVPLERKTFPYISHFFVHIQPRIKYLRNKIGISSTKITFQNVGVDFDRFKPYDSKTARTQLGLPQNAYIMLYVGGLVKTKGVDKILKAHRILKRSHTNIYLLLIGGQKGDPLYDSAKNTADQVVETIKNTDMPLYYNACDVYCFFGNMKTIQYAGIGTAPTEALASNSNVISTNLVHIPGYKTKRIGFVPKNFEDFVSKLDFLIRHPKFRFNARETIAPYTSNDHMTKNLFKVYDKLFLR